MSYLIFVCLSNVSMIEVVQAHDLKKIKTHIAHEGPVCVPKQNRLYFTTKPTGKRQTNRIAYLDLKTHKIRTWLKALPMANGMLLNNKEDRFIVAEQGNFKSHSAIVSYDINTQKRDVIVESYDGLPFNSLNKVIQTRQGWLYFTDPNYGEYQGFKLPSKIKNGLYLYKSDTDMVVLLTEQFDMPHGLSLDNKNNILFLSDTAALNGRDPYNKNKSRDIYQIKLKENGGIASTQHFATIKTGIPDGLLYRHDKLYVAAGNGVWIYNMKGEINQQIPIPKGAVTLTFCQGKLYVLSDSGIYSFDP